MAKNGHAPVLAKDKVLLIIIVRTVSWKKKSGLFKKSHTSIIDMPEDRARERSNGPPCKNSLRSLLNKEHPRYARKLLWDWNPMYGDVSWRDQAVFHKAGGRHAKSPSELGESTKSA